MGLGEGRGFSSQHCHLGAEVSNPDEPQSFGSADMVRSGAGHFHGAFDTQRRGQIQKRSGKKGETLVREAAGPRGKE